MGKPVVASQEKGRSRKEKQKVFKDSADSSSSSASSSKESAQCVAQHQSEIDEVEAIFSSIVKHKKRKEETKAEESKKDEEEKREKKKLEKKIKLAEDASDQARIILSPDPPIHRWDKESGLPVYKYAALKVGDGGGTPLCPFDCDCCF